MASERLAEVERLLCERYNVRALDGPLAEAIAADDVATLKAHLADRNLYRWHDAILAALPKEAVNKGLDTAEEDESEGKPISRMNKAELLAQAAELGLDVSEDATNAELRDLLTTDE